MHLRAALPPDAPGRAAAHDELHIRPARPLPVPSMTTQLTVVPGDGTAAAETTHLHRLAAAHGLTVDPTDIGLTLELEHQTGLSWERHDDYSLYTIHQPFDPAAFTADATLLALLPLPKRWLADIPGRTLSAVHAVLLPADGRSDEEAAEFAQQTLGQGRLLGSLLRDDAARLYTTYRLFPDGTSRFLILCNPMTEGRAGRITGSLLDVERYRMLALLAYPPARSMVPRLLDLEARLAELAHGIEDEDRDDRALLDELIGLAALVEYEIARHVGRFDAADAYYAIVEQRIEYLRRASLPGLMGVFTFLRRRLVPAMSTVDAARHRMEALSGRISRTADVLRTRVEVAAETQTQQLLDELRRGQGMQLRLQQTVEGLSIAAISYYIVGLVGYLAKGLKSAGVPINESMASAVAIPIAVLIVWRTVHRVRRHVHRLDADQRDNKSDPG
ncbi:hypothetical protein BN1232_05816 [Mycobacterium lentiflavum]|uniref:Membrane-anchored protein n=1 Tax=Mycobacterium lentiflavum TaxID=141349 RepID=A0A0E4H1L2_MYCLN|nr:DUF3422 domain-containing protein [Mycobacterium lentiflavum]CQD22987.1 hypothetical protein BN1232_05816 [Mycobacterium lentiflavum]